MNRFVKIILLLCFSTSCVFAKHIHKESYYQNMWCKEHNGITEYILPDKTRIDCLLKDYAVEFDFASKWAESIGQSLYYAKMTGKKPAIVLIFEESSDEKYYERANILAKDYNITLYKMKSENCKNNYSSDDIISELINCFKNWLKLILINIIDKL